MKIGRNASTGRFTTSRASKKGGGEVVKIRDKQTGRELPLKGYGALKGRYAVKPGVDLSKPIAAQTASKKKK